jgi:hypothetical protein
MPTLGIYTNCQGGVINDLFLSKMPFFSDWNIIYLLNYRMIQDTVFLNKDDLQKCDVFLYQPVSERHGVYSTLNDDGILGMLRPDCLRISFPSLYLDIWPIYEDSGYYYGAEDIIRHKNLGYTLEDVLKMYQEDGLSFNLKQRFEDSLAHLISREKYCTIQTVSSYICEHSNIELLFSTQNHPKPKILYFLSQEICKAIKNHYQTDFISIVEYDPDALLEYGYYEQSKYMNSELGVGYITHDHYEYYSELITHVYMNPATTRERSYSLQLPKHSESTDSFP